MGIPSVERSSYEQFVRYLRSALHYLYDPVHLRRSPLVDMLGLAGEFDRAAALQHILTEAIRALKPAEDEPPQSRAWGVYDTLNFQYIRQSARDAVATQLGISERQLRREQRRALEALAHYLLQKSDLASPKVIDRPEQTATRPALEAGQALSEELVWLQNPVPEPRIPLNEVLHTVHSLAQPLAEQWQVPLRISVPGGLSQLPVTQLALRHILLTILSVAIPHAGQGEVVIAAAQLGAEIELRVTCCDSRAGQMPFSDKDAAILETAQNLATFYGAQLSFSHQKLMGFAVTLTLPAPERIPVLVIDDNADWLELLQRYTAGSRYQVVGTRQPETARSLVQKVQPAVIFLDVMMHDMDGWQVLSDLRHEPAMGQLPIVICTVLPVESLALSLSANAFLQKPVTLDQFLKVLDQQVSLSGRPSSIRR